MVAISRTVFPDPTAVVPTSRREFLVPLATSVIGIGLLATLPVGSYFLQASPTRNKGLTWPDFLGEVDIRLGDVIENIVKADNAHNLSEEVLLWCKASLTNTPGYQMCSGWQLLNEIQPNGSVIVNLNLCRRNDYSWHKIRIDTGISAVV